MALDKLAKCIQDLRKLNDESPNETIQDATYYLDIFLEKLLTKEIEVVKYGCGTLRMNMICPPDDLIESGFMDWTARKIQASFEWEMDKVLSNYEEDYGLEPFTYKDAKLLCNAMDLVTKCFPKDDKDQAQFFGYKLYKKKIRGEYND